MRVSRVAEMRAMDRTAVEVYGIAPELLMENAGHALYFVILTEFGIKGRNFVVFCGLGNNGGDGLVVARKIHSSGGLVRVFMLGDPDKLHGAARTNYGIVCKLPLQLHRIEDADPARVAVAQCDAIVDAMLGTGITREVAGVYRQVVELINASGKMVFSVDIPSGVHGDTGQVMGAAVRADATATFGLPKLGSLLPPGSELCGKLFVSHISFPPELYETDALKVKISDASTRLPAQGGAGGQSGAALFIVGAVQERSGPYLAPRAFRNAGGARALLCAPDSHPTPAGVADDAILRYALAQGKSFGRIEKERSALLGLVQQSEIVVLGPGWPRTDEARRQLGAWVVEMDRPLLLSGEALASLAADAHVLQRRTGGTIFALRAAQLATIAQVSFAQTEANKVDILQRAAADLNAIVILTLQDGRALIGYPDGRVLINLSGQPGLDPESSDDILAGTIAAMSGMGLPLDEAVAMGVFVHGLAADLAADSVQGKELDSAEVLDHLPVAARLGGEGLSETLKQRYAGPRIV